MPAALTRDADLATASWYRRSSAEMVDGLIFIPMLFLHWRRGRHREPSRHFQVAMLLLSGAYNVVCHALTGQTVGERLVGIRVVSRNTHRPPSWSASLMRWLVRLPPDLVRLLPARRSDRVA